MVGKKFSANNSNKKVQSNREKMRVHRRTAVASAGRQLNGLRGIYINKRTSFGRLFVCARAYVCMCVSGFLVYYVKFVTFEPHKINVAQHVAKMLNS